MNGTIRVAVIVLFFSQVAFAAPQQKHITNLTEPSTQTIPQNYLDSMNRQEERLDQIDSKMTGIDTSLRDFKEETQRTLGNIDLKLGDMAATNVVTKFVLAIVVLVIPTLLGVWYSDYLKRRRSTVLQ